ncbi:hypothetical protein POM88_007193 [Heracleum sosnowskyi]|uniref:Uncharacterized protein n=1 Tax=Heracleum sosnowskyi TaxID=360622 RepID=A0AAD8J7N8_9APIA|nr:hypothetical protein POM88_007193 [Heracleum sosnowskyi]
MGMGIGYPPYSDLDPNNPFVAPSSPTRFCIILHACEHTHKQVLVLDFCILLRRDEALYVMLMKPRRPRVVVMCPTKDLSEQVCEAKSVIHHAKFRCTNTMVGGGGRLRPQDDSLDVPIDMGLEHHARSFNISRREILSMVTSNMWFWMR